MGHEIGIDLGTTYSAVAVFNAREGRFVIIPSRKGSSTTPSAVNFKNNEVVVGADAKARMAVDPDNTVAEIKRYMGEPVRGEDHEPKLDPNGTPMPYTVRFAGKEHSPQMISAYILKELKAIAEQYLGEEVTGAVITVPAHFTGLPRQATEEAGRLAGLNVRCLISEPTAAAIAFGLTGQGEEDGDDDKGACRRILVYDLGGGTFDVSIIEVAQGNIQVLGTDGNQRLGGIDFDRAIVKWLLDSIREKWGVDLSDLTSVDPATANMRRAALARIGEQAEQAKIALSIQRTVTINLPFLFHANNQPVNVEEELNRNTLLMMIGPQLKGTLATVDRALAAAGLSTSDIDDVLLVGGSTRIPKIKELLEKHFGKAPRTDINPDECVALGAAMQALRYADPSRLSPEQAEKVDRQREQMGDVVDITGHSLGVREGQDNMSVLIKKNTAIPAVAEETYQTSQDYQTSVRVCVYQGEDPVASRNTLLTDFEVGGLPPMPAGHLRIRITFELDINGVLRVNVLNLGTNAVVQQTARYGGIENVSQDQLAAMRGASPPTGKPDKSQKIPPHLVETWERAKALLGKLSPGPDHAALDAAMKALEAAIDSGDGGAVEARGEALIDVFYDVVPLDGASGARAG